MNIFHDIIINFRPFKHWTKYPNMMDGRSPSKYTFLTEFLHVAGSLMKHFLKGNAPLRLW